MRNIILGVASFALVSGCATLNGENQTAVQRAMGQCAVTIGGAAIIGAVIGNNVGDGDAGAGALAGAAVGAGVCGFLLYRASEEDKQRIRDLELAALNNQQVGTTTETFMSTNGEDEITVVTSVAEVPDDELPEIKFASYTPEVDAPVLETAGADSADTAPAEIEVEYTNCRYIKQDMSMAGQTLKGDQQLTCRTTGGDWVNF